MGKKKDKGHIRDWTSQKTEMDLGRAYQQNMGQPMDTAYHHLKTL